MSKQGWLGIAFAVAAGGGLVFGGCPRRCPSRALHQRREPFYRHRQPDRPRLATHLAAPRSLGTDAYSTCPAHDQSFGFPGSGWRLPTIKELQTTVDRSRTNPATDEEFFPETNSETFWSATCLAGGPACTEAGSSAWVVDFDNGSVNFTAVSSNLRVRCVR
jgi:hypothetical protein